jgi:hypothetical protein
MMASDATETTDSTVLLERAAVPFDARGEWIAAVRVRGVAAGIRDEFDTHEEVARWVTPLMLMHFALACLEQFGSRAAAPARSLQAAIDHVRRVASVTDEEEDMYID